MSISPQATKKLSRDDTTTGRGSGVVLKLRALMGGFCRPHYDELSTRVGSRESSLITYH